MAFAGGSNTLDYKLGRLPNRPVVLVLSAERFETCTAWLRRLELEVLLTQRTEIPPTALQLHYVRELLMVVQHL